MENTKLKVMMPKVAMIGNELSIVLDVAIADKESVVSFALDSIIFINRFGETFSYQNEDAEYYPLASKGCRIRKTISFGDKRQSLTNSKLFVILTSISERMIYDISYERFNDAWKVLNALASKTNDVKKYRNAVTDYEKISAKPVAKISLSSPENNIRNQNLTSEENPDEVELTDDEIIEQAPTSIKDYVRAIFREMYYIKDKGGRRYRVTNGKYVKMVYNKKADQHRYVYVFDIDSELFVAEDSPVRIEVGLNTAEGSVYYTNGFQIMIASGADLGKTVSSAFIMAEPWKLLKFLAKKVSSLSLTTTPMAIELLERGPLLAEPSKQDEIRKGQKEAIRYAYENPISVIWGPPGTGKSYVMAEMSQHFVEEGKKVLLVSHSNIAVDAVINKIVKLYYDNNQRHLLEAGNIIRYGYVRDPELAKEEYATSYNYVLAHDTLLNQRMDMLEREKERVQKQYGMDSPQFVDIIAERRELSKNIAEEEKKTIGNAKVVGTTVAKLIMDPALSDRKFDVVMFDEASMAYVGQIAVAAGFAREKFICVGDFNQLAPICQSEQKQILEKDIFSHLNISTNSGVVNYHPWLTMLDEQYRTHPQIAAFPSKYFYGSMLRTHSSVLGKVQINTQNVPFRNYPLVYVDLYGTYAAASSNDSNSRYNIYSAFLAIIIARRAMEGTKTDKDFSVGIITPYSAQARLVRAMIADSGDKELAEVKCSTVHQFQGSECDVIIFDTVENYPFTKPGLLLRENQNRNIDRLVNVAITRSKAKFIMIGNSRFWSDTMGETGNSLYRLTKYMQRNAHIISHENGLLERMCKAIGTPYVSIYSNSNDAIRMLNMDLDKAHKEIAVSIPDGKLKDGNERIIQALNEAGKKILLGIKCSGETFSELPEKWKLYSKGTDNSIFPIIVVDGNVLWYGLPISRGRLKGIRLKGQEKDYITVCHIYFRYFGEKAVEIINMFSQLQTITAGSNQKPLLSSTVKSGMLNSGTSLEEYVREQCHCSKCGGKIELKKSHGGRYFLRCQECEGMSYITPEEVNHYISINGVCCKKHKSDIEARVSKFGIYAWCIEGEHSIELFDL